MPSATPRVESTRRRPVDLATVARSASVAVDRLRPVTLGPIASCPAVTVDLRSIRFLLDGESFRPRVDDVTPVTLTTPTSWIDVDMLVGTTQSRITSGQTIYVGMFEDTDVEDVSIPLPAGQAAQLVVEATSAPGSSQSFTYTVVKNGVDQSMVITVSDLATGGSTISNPVTLSSNGDRLAIKLVTSAGAATAKHRFSIRYQISA